MGQECDKCGDKLACDCQGCVGEKLIDGIIRIGRAQQMLTHLLDDGIFENLSKHNNYWNSEDEVDGDKLFDVRMKLSCLKDNLWELMAILQPGDGI